MVPVDKLLTRYWGAGGLGEGLRYPHGRLTRTLFVQGALGGQNINHYTGL